MSQIKRDLQEWKVLSTSLAIQLIEGKWEGEFEGWIANIVGGICHLNSDMTIDMESIIYCLDNNVSIDLYYDWYWYVAEDDGSTKLNLKNFHKLNLNK